MGERILHAVTEMAWKFDTIRARPGHKRNPMAPDFATLRRDGIAEGQKRIWILGRDRGLSFRGLERSCAQNVTMENRPSMAGSSSKDCRIGPFALGFEAAVSAGFLERDLDLRPPLRDRANRMSPTHSNKLGVRCRYYVSHAILQNCKAEVGGVARVPAPEIESLVPASRPTPEGHGEPVSVNNRTSLRPTETKIEKWRAGTGARNPPRTDQNTGNCRPRDWSLLAGGGRIADIPVCWAGTRRREEARSRVGT